MTVSAEDLNILVAENGEVVSAVANESELHLLHQGGRLYFRVLAYGKAAPLFVEEDLLLYTLLLDPLADLPSERIVIRDLHSDAQKEGGGGFSSRSGTEARAVAQPLVQESDLMSLPKGEAFALLSGGSLYKLRIPLIADDGTPPEKDRHEYRPMVLVAFTLCLLLRVGYGLPVPQGERIANLQARIDADLAHIDALTGGEGAARARRWAATAIRLLPTAASEAIAVASIKDDLFTWFDRGFSGIWQVFSLNLQLSAVRASELLGSLPLGMLALAAGAANGCASRHVGCGRPLRLCLFWRRILSWRRHVLTPVHMECQEGDSAYIRLCSSV